MEEAERAKETGRGRESDDVMFPFWMAKAGSLCRDNWAALLRRGLADMVGLEWCCCVCRRGAKCCASWWWFVPTSTLASEGLSEH